MKNERVITAHFSYEAIEGLGLNPDDRIIYEKLENFTHANKNIEPFTEKEAKETVETYKKIRGELEMKDRPVILHIVSSNHTAGFLRNDLAEIGFDPKDENPLITEMYLHVGNNHPKQLPQCSENTITINTDGSMDTESKKKLKDCMDLPWATIIMGGGPTYATDPAAIPVLKGLEIAMKHDASFIGICLGNQFQGVLQGYKHVPDMVAGGPQIEKKTESGKRHPILERFREPYIATAGFHTAMIAIPEGRVNILTRSPSLAMLPNLVEYDTGKIGSQLHPEIPLGFEKETVGSMESYTIDGETIVVPDRASDGVRMLMRYAHANLDKFKKCGFSARTFKDYLTSGLAVEAGKPGKNIIGPIIEYLGSVRLASLSKH